MAFAACTTATQQRRGGLAELKPDAYPGELRAPSAMPGNFVLRQYVTAHWRERGEKKKRGFDAVVGNPPWEQERPGVAESRPRGAERYLDLGASQRAPD